MKLDEIEEKTTGPAAACVSAVQEILLARAEGGQLAGRIDAALAELLSALED